MPQMSLPMIRGDKKSNYDYRDNLLVNMTSIIRNIDGDQGYILTHDGLTEFSETNGVARGGVYNERFRQHYRVSGNTFESIDTNGNTTVLGTVIGTSTCSFANSFNSQAILSDGKVYYWDSATLTQLTDPELGIPIDVTWFRGIYVFTDGEFLYHTDVNDEFSISPLKYSSSEFSADPIKAVARNDQNQIVAFNRYSVEYFIFNANAPVGTSVLQVISGKAARIGIIGTHCQASLDGVFFILGGRKEESPSIHILNSGQESTIATREIDKVISLYTENELSNAFLEVRVVDRDKFLIAHLANHTLLYNHTIGSQVGLQNAWSYVKTGVHDDLPWRGKFGVFDPRNAKWIYGDIQENKLAYLDQTSAAQYGEQVENICYTPIIPIETQSIDGMEINTITGYTSGLFSSFLSMSSDGITYGKEYTNIISAPSNYNTRYVCRRLGYVRDSFNFKFRFVSVDKMAFSGLVIGFS